MDNDDWEDLFYDDYDPYKELDFNNDLTTNYDDLWEEAVEEDEGDEDTTW